MANTSVITAIDLGTDKCSTLIATLDPATRQLRVVGTAAVNARGVRKSTIIDLEQVLETITESVDAAERMAGFEIKHAYVSVSGPHITSQNSKGVVAVANPNQEITREDVARVIEAARALSLPGDREIIHIVPRHFKVDSQDGIKDPVGMTGVRLEAEAHIVTGMTTSLKNLDKCLKDLGLSVDGFVFSGLAAAEVVISETERELGVIIADVGAGCTSLAAFVEGSLVYSGTLPIGARHITQDIALGCRVSLETAEKIKLALTHESEVTLTPHAGESKEDLQKRRKKADMLDLTKLGITESVEIMSKRAIIEGIMVPRMKEIATMIGQVIDREGLTGQVPAGVVLCGGGAETVGFTEVAKRTLSLPARVGTPAELSGLIGDIRKSAYAVPIGLLVYGQRQGGGGSTGEGFSLSGLLEKIPVGALLGQLQKFWQSLLP
jgi:cell division protein FtsA